jgi:3-keto-5-aminohexanoate cleavage enzyme
MTMEPLIITATPNICWLHPEIAYPQSAAELAEEARLCSEAGATVMHMHHEPWPETVPAVRDATPMIVQCGMSSFPIPQRTEVFELKADMISIITSHHDEAFAEVDCYALHTREELVEYAELQERSGVRLEYEIWNTGSIWNLDYLRKRELVDPPYHTTLFLGWPGGQWSPPTVEEYLYRRRHLPEGSVATVSVMGEGQMELLTSAIVHGDHVRVGTEDNPFGRDGRPATTHQLVAEIAEVARAVGRPIASPAEARRIIGIRNS